MKRIAVQLRLGYARAKRVLLLAAMITAFITYANYCSLAADDNTQLAFLGANDAASSAALLGMAQKVSLDLRNIDVIEALKFLSMKSGLNIVPTQKVSGRITLRVENVPVKDIFDIMLRSNSLAYDKRGEIFNVMTEAEYKAFYGKNFSDPRQVKVIRLKYAVPQQAFSLLDAVKSDIGRLLVEPDTGTVLLMDTPEKIKEALDTLELLEQKASLKIFSLKYAKAKDVEEQLKTQLDLKKVGTIKSDDRNNQVIVQTFPERMKDIEKLIAGLDKKTREVLIDTKIIKIKLSNQLDTGIQWEGLFNLAKQWGMTYLGSYPFSLVQSSTTAAWQSRQQFLQGTMNNKIGAYPFSGTVIGGNLNTSQKIAPGQNMHVGIIDGKRDFDVLVNYLRTLGKTKILSNPSLAVINNQEAKIHIGERRAFVTTTTTAGASTTTVSEEVTYVDVGVQLSITPQINEDGYVIMKIKPEISSVIGNVTTSSKNVIPIIDTSTAETTVMAKDGSTILLGGLGGEEKTDSSEGVPILSKIPLLGFFFKTRSQSTTRTELVIMITPVIFDGERMVSTKDKEMEKYGVKSPKKFDVFRGGVSSEKNQDSADDIGVFKGLATGEGKEPVDYKEMKPYDAADVSTEKEGGVLEGVFRSYSVNSTKREDAVAVKSVPVSAKKEDSGPKGFKVYTAVAAKGSNE